MFANYLLTLYRWLANWGVVIFSFAICLVFVIYLFPKMYGDTIEKGYLLQLAFSKERFIDIIKKWARPEPEDLSDAYAVQDFDKRIETVVQRFRNV